MKHRISKATLGVSAAAVLAGAALASPLIASAQSSTPTPSAPGSTAPAEKGGGSGETVVTGDAASKASAAALGAVPGGTVDRVSTENDGPAGVSYEVKVTKADGSKVKVLLGSAFDVVSTKAGRGPGGPGRGGKNETPLAADIATKVTDAAKAAVPDGTVGKVSAETEDAAGAAYEAHVTKADGSSVEVILDSNFAVLTTQPAKRGPGR